MAVCTEYNRFWNTSRERRTAIPRRIVGRPEEVRTDKTQRNAETAHHVGPPQRSKSARAAPNGEGRIPIHRAGARIRNPTPAISRAALIKPGTGIKHQPAPRRLTPDPCFHPSGHSLIRTETVARHPDELRPRVLTPFRAFADLDAGFHVGQISTPAAVWPRFGGQTVSFRRRRGLLCAVLGWFATCTPRQGPLAHPPPRE